MKSDWELFHSERRASRIDFMSRRGQFFVPDRFFIESPELVAPLLRGIVPVKVEWEPSMRGIRYWALGPKFKQVQAEDDSYLEWPKYHVDVIRRRFACGSIAVARLEFGEGIDRTE